LRTKPERHLLDSQALFEKPRADYSETKQSSSGSNQNVVWARADRSVRRM
ncbi:hypothetical protein BgiMline_020049, partial [Biomphalaria glabrata]